MLRSVKRKNCLTEAFSHDIIVTDEPFSIFFTSLYIENRNGGDRLTDRELIGLYVGRSETAIEKTLEQYGNYCFTIAFNILRSKEDAEECVNDALYRAWDAVPNDPPRNLRPYLGRITRNEALDRYRKGAAVKRGEGNDMLAPDELAECVSGNAADESETIATRELLKGFIASLGREKKTVFLARYWYGYTVAEIAKKTGRKENTIKTMLRRTRNELCSMLKKEGLY